MLPQILSINIHASNACSRLKIAIYSLTIILEPIEHIIGVNQRINRYEFQSGIIQTIFSAIFASLRTKSFDELNMNL